MIQYPVHVRVYVESPRGEMVSAKEYSHDGKVYVEGQRGQRYEIRVINLTSRRVELVPSVDGLDVHDGQEASYEKRGLVIPACGDGVLKGFRLSGDHVATFRFGGVEEAYATKIGKPRNIGVIGLAVFEELAPVVQCPKVPIRPNDYDDHLFDFHPTKGGDGQRDLGIGTVFGERREDHVGTTMFTRVTKDPVVALSLRYEDRVGLEALGIKVVIPHEMDQRETALAFPGSFGFAKPPYGWRE